MLKYLDPFLFQYNQVSIFDKENGQTCDCGSFTLWSESLVTSMNVGCWCAIDRRHAVNPFTGWKNHIVSLLNDFLGYIQTYKTYQFLSCKAITIFDAFINHKCLHHWEILYGCNKYKSSFQLTAIDVYYTCIWLRELYIILTSAMV